MVFDFTGNVVETVRARRQIILNLGRLARLPLPRELAAWLRSARATLENTVKNLFSTTRQEL